MKPSDNLEKGLRVSRGWPKVLQSQLFLDCQEAAAVVVEALLRDFIAAPSLVWWSIEIEFNEYRFLSPFLSLLFLSFLNSWVKICTEGGGETFGKNHKYQLLLGLLGL